MKVKIKLAHLGMLAVVLLAIVAITQVTVMAAYLGSTTVAVTVSDLTEVTVLPTSLSFTAAPGAVATAISVDIKNTGSNNISNIYASVDTLTDETSDPIPAGGPSGFASTGFLVLKNSTATEYFHAGRLEWNLSTLLTGASYGSYRYNATGFFRNVSGMYMWILGNTTTATNAGCNDTGATLYIEADADAGTAATRTPAVAGTLDESVTDWGLFSFTADPLKNYCVAAYHDCTKIYIYKYDYNATFDGCTQSNYLEAATLVPGDIDTITTNAWVSEGVPDGSTNSGVLTFHGTAA